MNDPILPRPRRIYSLDDDTTITQESEANEVQRIMARLREPLPAHLVQLLEDTDVIEAIPQAPTMPGALFRPDSEQMLEIEVFDMDWESVGAMCDKQGLTLVSKELGVAHFQMELTDILIGKPQPRAAVADITIRKAKEHTIINVRFNAVPEHLIKNFVVCSRALRQITEASQRYYTRHIAVSMPEPSAQSTQIKPTTKESLRRVHCKEERSNIATAFRRDLSFGAVSNRNSWAKSKYSITGKTLGKYLKEFPE